MVHALAVAWLPGTLGLAMGAVAHEPQNMGASSVFGRRRAGMVSYRHLCMANLLLHVMALLRDTTTPSTTLHTCTCLI